MLGISVNTVLAGKHRQVHPRCIWNECEAMLEENLSWTTCGQNGLRGIFTCAERFAGFPGTIHGGILSAVVDISCFHALLALDISAWTVDLNIRFRMPVRVGSPAEIRVDIVGCKCESLFELRVSMIQDKETKVSGTARFMNELAAKSR